MEDLILSIEIKACVRFYHSNSVDVMGKKLFLNAEPGKNNDFPRWLHHVAYGFVVIELSFEVAEVFTKVNSAMEVYQ
ncbi:MAG: hypothetical protein WBB23_22935 [Desulforhopalus sp.]